MMPAAPLPMGIGTSTSPDKIPQETSVQVPTSRSLSDCPYAAVDRSARQRTIAIRMAGSPVVSANGDARGGVVDRQEVIETGSPDAKQLLGPLSSTPSVTTTRLVKFQRASQAMPSSGRPRGPAACCRPLGWRSRDEILQPIGIFLEALGIGVAQRGQRVEPTFELCGAFCLAIVLLCFPDRADDLLARFPVLGDGALFRRGQRRRRQTFHQDVEHFLHASELLAVAAGAGEHVILDRRIPLVDRNVELRIDEALPVGDRVDEKVLEPRKEIEG